MKHTTWKWFFIRRFLLILALVSFSEAALNLWYEEAVYPWVEETFHISFFMANGGSGQTVGMLLRGVAFLAALGVCSQFPNIAGVGLQGLAEKFAGKHLSSLIISQTSHMSPKETWIYVLGTALFSILVVLTLLLPYAVAAVAFSHMVGQHIRQLEEQERRQQEEYNRRRNLLLSDVAHDLKTPMTTVAGYAKALLEEEGAPRREYLEAIYGKSMQMGGLLNLLFEYVKLDSEGYQLDKTEEDLWELLRECIAALYLDFEEKEMELFLEIPEEEARMPVDKLQFQRVATNLLNNAIRHNPKGTKVSVKAEWEDGAASICIRDNGAPIPEKTAAYIFDPFVSGDESRKSKGGSGLGLSIAHKIIAMHGGSLSLSQEPVGPWTKSFILCLNLPVDKGK